MKRNREKYGPTVALDFLLTMRKLNLVQRGTAVFIDSREVCNYVKRVYNKMGVL